MLAKIAYAQTDRHDRAHYQPPLYGWLLIIMVMTIICGVIGLFVAAVQAAGADNGEFYLRHMEYSQLVVAVKGRHHSRQAEPGKALVVRYSRNPPDGALMFKEDPKTRNIITVHRGLCITDDMNGTLMHNPISNSDRLTLTEKVNS